MPALRLAVILGDDDRESLRRWVCEIVELLEAYARRPLEFENAEL
jgi:hypothetical protein